VNSLIVMHSIVLTIDPRHIASTAVLTGATGTASGLGYDELAA